MRFRLAVLMEIPTASQLISAAKRARDKDDFDLAALLRQQYGLRTTQSSISRWRESPRGPSYEATFALLGLAGWLDDAAIRRDLAAAAKAAARDEARRAEEMARTLAGEQAPPRGKRRTA